MSVLSAQSIRSCLTIEPFCERTVHETGMSFGLSVSGYDLRIRDQICLWPSQFALVTTVERLKLPANIQGILLDKSSWARQGLSMFNTKFEPGWEGYPTVEVVNLSKRAIIIEEGAPLCQMEFHWLDAHSETPYNGKYQNQPNEPVPAKVEIR